MKKILLSFYLFQSILRDFSGIQYRHRGKGHALPPPPPPLFCVANRKNRKKENSKYDLKAETIN